MRRMMLIEKLRNTYELCLQTGENWDEEKIIALLGADEGVSRRTAIDYIRCAIARFEENKKQKIEMAKRMMVENEHST